MSTWCDNLSKRFSKQVWIYGNPWESARCQDVLKQSESSEFAKTAVEDALVELRRWFWRATTQWCSDAQWFWCQEMSRAKLTLHYRRHFWRWICLNIIAWCPFQEIKKGVAEEFMSLRSSAKHKDWNPTFQIIPTFQHWHQKQWSRLRFAFETEATWSKRKWETWEAWKSSKAKRKAGRSVTGVANLCDFSQSQSPGYCYANATATGILKWCCSHSRSLNFERWETETNRASLTEIDFSLFCSIVHLRKSHVTFLGKDSMSGHRPAWRRSIARGETFCCTGFEYVWLVGMHGSKQYDQYVFFGVFDVLFSSLEPTIGTLEELRFDFIWSSRFLRFCPALEGGSFGRRVVQRWSFWSQCWSWLACNG